MASSEAPKVCQHLRRSIQLAQLNRVWKALPDEEKKHCSTCTDSSTASAAPTAKKGAAVSAAAPAPSQDEGTVPVWMCVTCGSIGCGQNEPGKHALAHFEDKDHPVVVSPHTLMCWCYACDEEVMQEDDMLDQVRQLFMPEPESEPEVDESQLPSAATEVLTEHAPHVVSRVVGLRNLGNTCFFNSTMQNLMQLRAVVDFFCSDATANKEDGPMTLAFRSFTKDFRQPSPPGTKGKNGGANPALLFNPLAQAVPQFRSLQQQDAQELLRFLLDCIDREERKRLVRDEKRRIYLDMMREAEEEAKANAPAQPEGADETKATDGDAIPPPTELTKNVSYWFGEGASTRLEAAALPQPEDPPPPPAVPVDIKSDRLKVDDTKFETAITRIFGGMLASVVICDSCHTTSVKYDPMLDLSLQMPAKIIESAVSAAGGGSGKHGALGASGFRSKKRGAVIEKLKPLSKTEKKAKAKADAEIKLAEQAAAIAKKVANAKSAMFEVPTIKGVPQLVPICEPPTAKELKNADKLPLIIWLQGKANPAFLHLKKLDGRPKNVAKLHSKPELLKLITEWCEVTKRLHQESSAAVKKYQAGQVVAGEPASATTVAASTVLPAEPAPAPAPATVAIAPTPQQSASDELTAQVLEATRAGMDSDEAVDGVVASILPTLIDFDADASGCSTCTKATGCAPEFSSDMADAAAIITETAVEAFREAMQANFDELQAEWIAAEQEAAGVTSETATPAAGVAADDSDDSSGDGDGNAQAEDSDEAEGDDNEGDTKEEPAAPPSCVQGDSWACPTCTLLNPLKATKCGVCEAARPAEAAAAAEVAAKLAVFSVARSYAGLILPEPADRNNKELSLINLMKLFTAPERLLVSTGDGYLCEACNAAALKANPDVRHFVAASVHLTHGSQAAPVFRNATKRLLLYRAPNVLTVHIKRFAQTMRGRFAKLSEHVSFPERLDISACFAYPEAKVASPPSVVYRLRGLVVHSGTMGGGHYVAYVRSGEQWYYISDTSVSLSTLAAALAAQAYMLFYELL